MSSSVRRTEEQIKGGVAFLKQADRLVKEGNMREALAAVESAKSVDPLNPYLEAYVARLAGVLNSEEESTRAEKKREEEAVRKHITRAQQLCLEARYELALEELAHAFLIDPSNQDLVRLKNEIKHAQNTKKDITQIAIDKEISQRVETAETMLGQGQFDNAIQELTQAFILDPVNDILLSFESKHLRTIRRHQERRMTLQAAAA